MKTYFWEGYCHTERHSGITAIQKVIQTHGDILQVNWFSDISIAFQIEIMETKLASLHAQLQTVVTVKQVSLPVALIEGDCTLFLNITFAKATGNLTQEIPAVPG